MRINFKKLFLVLLVLCVLLFLGSYLTAVEVQESIPKYGRVVDMEKSLDKLQTRLDDQLVESHKLLNRVRQHLKKTEHRAKESVANDQREQVVKEIKEVIVSKTVLPVLVIACDRITVQRCLDNLVRFRPDKEVFPIIVSQDCGHNATYHVIKRYVDEDPSISVIRQPDLSEIRLPRHKIKFSGYYKIARHFRFALNYVFKTLKHEAVIIVEDDLDISPDFFEYFLGTYPLLLKDPTLWCISAWNDNGKMNLIDRSRPELLHRTDFFPGLGWLLRRDSWAYLEPNWPQAFFDDWLRNPVNTKGKACIRPEISRTYTFGKIGVSRGLFYENHLRFMQLNSDFVQFTKLDLNYLIKDKYDEALKKEVEDAELKEASDLRVYAGVGEKVKVTYHDAKSFQRAAKTLGLMDDFRSGIPRTAYQGIVNCFILNRRVYLVPDFHWTRYDPSWG